MFVSYLSPFPYRHSAAPYLFVFYKQLGSALASELAYIGSADYFVAPEVHGAAGRWEFEPQHQLALGYTLPEETQVRAARREVLDDALLTPLHTSSVSTLDAFRRLLTEPYPPLQQALLSSLRRLATQAPLEAVLTWVNCPSLSAAAAELGLPVLHHELGALRAPLYPPTAYFDFSGVNGNTEAAARFERFLAEFPTAAPAAPLPEPLLEPEELRRLLVRAPVPQAPPPAFPRGVALQVEDDSNLVAFSRGWNNYTLLHEARRGLPPGALLVRPHPGGHLQPRLPPGQLSQGESSLAFLQRCGELWCTNSSLGLEALLFEKPTRLLGACAFEFLGEDALAHLPPAERTHRRRLGLNFLLLGYLVPYSLLFDPDYTRWRLTRPSERALLERHLAHHRAQRPTEDTPQRTAPVLSAPDGGGPATQATDESESSYRARLEQRNRSLCEDNRSLELWARDLAAGNDYLHKANNDLHNANTDLQQRLANSEAYAAATRQQLAQLEARLAKLTAAARSRVAPTAP